MISQVIWEDIVTSVDEAKMQEPVEIVMEFTQ